jgi:hypothetical protein
MRDEVFELLSDFVEQRVDAPRFIFAVVVQEIDRRYEAQIKLLGEP